MSGDVRGFRGMLGDAVTAHWHSNRPVMRDQRVAAWAAAVQRRRSGGIASVFARPSRPAACAALKDEPCAPAASLARTDQLAASSDAPATPRGTGDPPRRPVDL